MSRIGKAPITIPQGVDVQVNGNVVTVKGKLGELSQVIDNANITVSIEEGVLSVERANDEKDTRAQHGLYRALINNMVVGVSEGFKKELEMVGVGYRAANQGQQLDISVGYSHNIVFELPKEVSVETKAEKGKNPLITLTSHDKQLLGAVASKIRSFRKPEPYKGKGIRFVGEHIRRKAGKSAAKK